MPNINSVPQEIEREYLAIERFAEKYNRISYLQLDNYVTQKVNLFALPEHERFNSLEFLLDKIVWALPALKRILSKPITRLKDVESVLPVEAVRVINNSTMSHIAIHTELWGNVDEKGLKPRKLKTLSHEEEYKIYENVATVRLVNSILAFVKKNTAMIKDIMYSCQPMKVNLLERTNHLMYFLAIGKLHVGYAHAQDKYNNIHQRCLEKLNFIDKSLRAKLNAPVYKICKKDHSKLILKKTNVFRLQKDYKQVYALLKLFADKDELVTEHMNAQALPVKAYADYCTLLSLFAIGHFNFEFKESDSLDFQNLKAVCNYKGWKLTIARVSSFDVNGLKFTVKKDQTYTVCLINYTGEKIDENNLAKFKKKHPADEYLNIEPFDLGRADSVYMNLFDISSFRRIQQLIYRAMIYSDAKMDTCAFCGSAMEKTANGAVCPLCKSVVTHNVCNVTGKSYFSTTLKDYKVPLRKTDEQNANLFTEKENEALLFFRNITPINKRGKPICPHCKKQH